MFIWTVAQPHIILNCTVKKRKETITMIYIYYFFLHPQFVKFISPPRERILAVSEERSCDVDDISVCACVCLPSSYWQWTQSIVSPVCPTCRTLPTSLTSTGTLYMRRRWRPDLSLMLVWKCQISTNTYPCFIVFVGTRLWHNPLPSPSH